MSVRILMTTVAALALALPAMAQDQPAPSDTQQPPTEMAPEQGAEGAGEQTPAVTDEAPAATDDAPAMTEETPPASGDAPAMSEETPPASGDAPAMTEEAPPATGDAPAMTEEAPAGAPADQEMAEETPPADMEFLQVQEEAQFLANDEVIGKDVVNEFDETVGTIADLVMDQDQKLVGVVLSVGGFLGIGDKWVAISVEQIDFPNADDPARLLAVVSEEQLTNAPDFMTREEVDAEQAASDASLQQQAPAPAVPAQ